MDSESNPELQFKHDLRVMHSSDMKTMLLTKDEYFNLKQEWKEASSLATLKSNGQYYILKR